MNPVLLPDDPALPRQEEIFEALSSLHEALPAIWADERCQYVSRVRLGTLSSTQWLDFMILNALGRPTRKECAVDIIARGFGWIFTKHGGFWADLAEPRISPPSREKVEELIRVWYPEFLEDTAGEAETFLL